MQKKKKEKKGEREINKIRYSLCIHRWKSHLPEGRIAEFRQVTKQQLFSLHT